MKIGIFDSGLGGLTIFREILKQVNAEFIYFADNKNTPYGVKEETFVKQCIDQNMNTLMQMGCQYIVIACNTATAVAIDDLRKKYPTICFIGTEPALKKAIDESDNQRIIVAATTNTLHSQRMQKLINKLHAQDRVDLLALDKLVLFAENKDTDRNMVEQYLITKLSTFDLEKYSHIVFGCTHFPLFQNLLEKNIPRHVQIIDGSVGVTKQLIKCFNAHHEIIAKNNQISLLLTKPSDVFVDKMSKILQLSKKEIHVSYV